MNMGEDFMALLGKKEDLHSDLVDHVGDVSTFKALRHPLLYAVPYSEIQNALLNRQYEEKMKALLIAETNEDWESYVMIHERPYRFPALMRIAIDCEASNPKMFWELVANVYIDSENIHASLEDWELLFNSRVERKPEWLMDEDELTTFQSITKCKRVPLYRGYNVDGSPNGLSWTLSYDRAVWFARRNSSTGHNGCYVASALFPKQDLLMYKNGRGEEEVVLKRIPDFTGLIHSIKKVDCREVKRG